MTVHDTEVRPKRRRAETVERLLDAALDTFAEIGFAAASVEDICRRGGFTRGAFYSSFRTKDELFAALFARETARNLALAEEQLAGLEHEGDPVSAAVERCLSSFRADRTWVLVHTEYALYATRHPEAAAALRRHAEELHRRLTALIDAAAARIGIRLTLPANRLARIVLALHDGVVIREVLGGGGAHGSAGDRAASDLERTALLLLLRSATTDSATTD
ncbi:TetR/AcrR family transcriptional regulator [Blastococcus sp. CT_GayMR16]|uniref:TetR/AcrR family transcriptional regulator n=1 Tax=Blastococcus sp. CT_GayMR16 TaxID=2559607 RepID=UPI001430A2DE|nr:TetR/AcrR family transcriptional regulator [Blastococcus sp. CT_GayMR16]